MPSRTSLPLIIAIAGPTAVGKSALSISLAKHFKTVVISADSRQMYRAIPIGTAQPSKEEQEGVPHYLLGHLDLKETCSAGQFERDAIQLIQGPLSKHEVIIVCGGSGLYLKALLHGLNEVPSDPVIRETLIQRHKSKGLDDLVLELERLDPISAARIDKANPQRIIRALEVCLSSAKPFSSFHTPVPKVRPFRSLLIGLSRERDDLRSRIAIRCRQMLKEGWIEEAKSVYNSRELNSLRTIGYQHLFDHLEGSTDLDTCEAAIIQETQRFAKRQMTWFRRMEGIQWIDLPDNEAFEMVLSMLKKS